MTQQSHSLSVDEQIIQLNSNLEQGLTEAEAEERLGIWGKNQLQDQEARGLLDILWEQVSNPMVVLLIVAAIVSSFLGEYKDALVILVIILLNGVLGFVQDYRAEKALAALKQLSTPQVMVRREGKVLSIEAQMLVPGDVVLLEPGRIVSADARIMESQDLHTLEAPLTGESLPIEKSVLKLDAKTPLAERKNQVYAGTEIVKGRATVMVIATGMKTELGKIAGMLSRVKRPPTPLQIRLAVLGRNLAMVALGIVVLVFVLGIFRGEDPKLMILTALGLAVAAVPEGLPAVATVALAMGAKKMFQQHALIRKLPAVETLGSVTTICSDKTGTLTRNEMTVTDLWVVDQESSLKAEEPLSLSGNLTLLMFGGALCNDGMVESKGEGRWQTLGDPTETALLVAAVKHGLVKKELDQAFPRIGEIGFSSKRKRMSTQHDLGGLNAFGDLSDALSVMGQGLTKVTIVKGALDYLLPLCSQILVSQTLEPMTEEWQNKCIDQGNIWAKRARRVLALCLRTQATPDGAIEESDLVFVGLFGMMDPPREEARLAISECKTAGIKPMMITGDHPLTAGAIAQDLGIDVSEEVITGQMIDELDDSDFDDVLKTKSVFARVAPEHKMKIVQSLKRQDHVVAMTGDGVNDAPALKQADIGVAMGITGTDVSKEASEMILLNDNFANIVEAVKQGRIVYDNIRKFVKYTLTSNMGEVLVMLMAPLFGMPLPLLPLQILWVNLVTDGLPGLALAVEPAEKNVMNRPPYSMKEGFFSKRLAFDIFWIGGVMGAVSLGAGYMKWADGQVSEGYFRTMVFMVLTLSQMGNALATRSELYSLFQIKIKSNLLMLYSVLLTLALQLLVVYTPWGRELLGTEALAISDLILCLGLSSIVFVLTEILKWRRRASS